MDRRTFLQLAGVTAVELLTRRWMGKAGRPAPTPVPNSNDLPEVLPVDLPPMCLPFCMSKDGPIPQEGGK